MVLDPAGFQVYKSVVKLSGEQIRAAGAGAGGQDRFEKVMDREIRRARRLGHWAAHEELPRRGEIARLSQAERGH